MLSTNVYDDNTRPFPNPWLPNRPRVIYKKVHSNNFYYYIHCKHAVSNNTWVKIIMCIKVVYNNKTMPFSSIGFTVFTLLRFQCTFCIPCFVQNFFHFFPISNDFSFRDYFQTFCGRWYVLNTNYTYTYSKSFYR